MSRIATSRLAVGLCSGVLLLGLAGLSPSSGTVAAERARSDGRGPNGASAAANDAARVAMRTIAPGGHATVKYLGKSRMKALPRSGATGQRSAGVHAPLRVPHWFKGPKVGSTMAKSTGPAPLRT